MLAAFAARTLAVCCFLLIFCCHFVDACLYATYKTFVVVWLLRSFIAPLRPSCRAVHLHGGAIQPNCVHGWVRLHPHAARDVLLYVHASATQEKPGGVTGPHGQGPALPMMRTDI